MSGVSGISGAGGMWGMPPLSSVPQEIKDYLNQLFFYIRSGNFSDEFYSQLDEVKQEINEYLKDPTVPKEVRDALQALPKDMETYASNSKEMNEIRNRGEFSWNDIQRLRELANQNADLALSISNNFSIAMR